MRAQYRVLVNRVLGEYTKPVQPFAGGQYVA